MENSPFPSLASQTIQVWLRDTADILADAMIPSAHLDAELILSHTIRKPRIWLHAHGEELIDERQLDILETRVNQRLERVPIAYIIGEKEFYGRVFTVNSNVLIPRPETEDTITQLIEWYAQNPQANQLVDVGTGSGCIGITAKLELPHLEVTLCDIDDSALAVAEQNKQKLNADVRLEKSDLLTNYPLKSDIITANLPYVDKSWEVSPETNHEPPIALFADNNGLALIYSLIEQSVDKLNPKGILLLESDPRQHSAIAHHAQKFGLMLQKTSGLIQLLQKH